MKSISEKFIPKLSKSPYVANELLNLIDQIEKKHTDKYLTWIKFFLNQNLIMETYDRKPIKQVIANVQFCIYCLEVWLFINKVKIKF